jgi:outer membrane lipoprotein SlyB
MMRKNRITTLVAVLSAAAFLVGCAATSGANYRPIVDNKGVDLNRYDSDLRECQSYALQTAGAADSAAGGALAGALFGAVLAGAAGKNYSKSSSARVGAVSGAVGAGVEGERNQKNIINRCLAGRGYRVLQ